MVVVTYNCAIRSNPDNMASPKPFQDPETNTGQSSSTDSDTSPTVSATSASALAAVARVAEPTGAHGGESVRAEGLASN